MVMYLHESPLRTTNHRTQLYNLRKQTMAILSFPKVRLNVLLIIRCSPNKLVIPEIESNHCPHYQAEFPFKPYLLFCRSRPGLSCHSSFSIPSSFWKGTRCWSSTSMGLGTKQLSGCFPHYWVSSLPSTTLVVPYLIHDVYKPHCRRPWSFMVLCNDFAFL